MFLSMLRSTETDRADIVVTRCWTHGMLVCGGDALRMLGCVKNNLHLAQSLPRQSAVVGGRTAPERLFGMSLPMTDLFT
jgi:hypothetical protein